MKSREESFEKSRGLFNIAVTPFDVVGGINFKALEENIDRVLTMGFDGLLIGGTYGEFAAMDLRERSMLFKHVMSYVGDDVPVLLCTADPDVHIVHELTKLASDLGGLPMVMPPFISEVNEKHIINFFKEVSSTSSTGLMIYNAPGVGINLSVKLIEEICDIDGVVALKQGDLQPLVVDQLVGRLRGKIRLLAASDLVMLGPLALGFDGLSSTNACALPELVKATYDAATNGSSKDAGSLHRQWYAMREVARKYGQPQSTKAAMNLRGWMGGCVRRPLLELNEVAKTEVRDALKLAGIDLD